MKTIAIMGHVGGGKTTIAIKKAVSLGFEEVLYVTDEISKMEFVRMLDRLFGDDLDIIMGDLIIYGKTRIKYVGANQPVPMHMYDVVVVDVHEKDTEHFFYRIVREVLIVTKQLNRYSEVIVV